MIWSQLFWKSPEYCRTVDASVLPWFIRSTRRASSPARRQIANSLQDSYLEEYRYSDWFERAGLEMTFYSQHRPLERYSRALEQAGMVIEAIREHRVPDHAASKPAARRWQRLPLFMHIRAFKLTR